MPKTLEKPSSKTSLRKILNPATEQVLAEVPDQSAADVDRAVQNAKKAFGGWSRKTPAERSAALLKLAQLLEDNAQRLAELESKNVGKPIKLAKDGDVPFAIDNLRYFAGVARHLEGRAAGEYSPGYASFIRREPIGVVGLVAPWNYPLMMAIWKLGPALAAGNTAVLKPSELTPLTTLELGKLAESALPEGVLNIVTGAEETGVALTSHKDIAMVSFTGDTETGKKIMAQAAPTLKKLHLELGGKAPFVVFEDADLTAALNGAAVASFVNSGQDCTAATRIYVHESVYKKFLLSFVNDFVAKIRVGDPSSPKTDMGSLVSADQLGRVEGFLKRHTQGRVLCGGKRPKGLAKGFFFEPTVIADVPQKAELMQREIFGPIVCVAPFRTEEEAIEKANDVPYGLAGSVWTSNIQRSIRVSGALRFGTVWINDHLPLASEMPHGGFKQSGFGKDMSAYALEEYTTVKHVMADTTGVARKPWHYTAFGDA
ncbi:MAG: gamma-aminobutyraldehyde dehydrogenase [Elusimicrobia bacterium]|nr:gamma-aminobutyraldehyde dehydrogenase [Elusimicrobiota bacterium]